MSTYPAEWESDVLLADGTPVQVRPIRPDDAEAHRAFFSRLSERTVYFRFFSPRQRLTDEEVRHFVTVDYVDRFALVALVGEDIIAVARFERLSDPVEAEVAFVVQDDYQGRGLGTLLLEHLAAAGRQRGIERFVADVLPENRGMLAVFHDAGFSVVDRFDEGVVQVAFPIEPTPEARAHLEAREHTAEARSIGRILAPRSVAMIGASNDPGSVGHHLFRNLLDGGFAGPVHPVNPSSPHVLSVATVPSVLDIDGEVDLAVIAVPADAVAGVIEQCGAKGVKGAVVVSAGFAEIGGEGARRQEEVADAATRAGMRLVGPNCVGVVNTAVGLNATFSPYRPRPGRVGVSSQSGALGIALLEWTDRLGVGISSFVSVGNKADVSGNDLLQFWEDDDSTDVVLLYLESFGNPAKFARIARRVSRAKPIVAVKAGRTEAGARAAGSHTAAMATSDSAVDALFRQTGVIRVHTTDQMLEVAQVLALQPLPAGRRVAIVGNSGGPGILAADACSGAGLEVSALSAGTQARLRDLLGPVAAVTNPVDMAAAATPEQYRDALGLVLADDTVDSVLAIYTPVSVSDPARVADVIAEVAAAAAKPVVATFVALPREHHGSATATVPVFHSPEPAARALGRIAEYALWRARDEGTVPTHGDLDVDRARAVVRRALVERPDGAWLSGPEAADLLGAFGIEVVAGRRFDDAASAAAHAHDIGFPVVLKAASPDLVHKSDAGGVRVGLGSADEVLDAFAAMQRSLGDAMGGGLVQREVEGGVEAVVGLVHHRSFGPLVMFGLGGVTTELLGDRAFRVLPLTDRDAAELVRSIRAAPLLFGYRGSPAVDVDALEDLLTRVGRLAELVPEIAEMDLNPAIVSERGVDVVDWRIRVEPRCAAEPDLVRRYH
jgi:acetyl coenzyme A synthetase (ADP forming)-like protein